MKGLDIYLKTGAVVAVDADDVTTSRSTVTGELLEMKWVAPGSAKRKLHFIDPTQIAAVVVRR